MLSDFIHQDILVFVLNFSTYRCKYFTDKLTQDAQKSPVNMGVLSTLMHKRLKFWGCITGLLTLVFVTACDVG